MGSMGLWGREFQGGGGQHVPCIIYSEFLFNNPSIITKVLQQDLMTRPKGSVSRNLDLGSRDDFAM